MFCACGADDINGEELYSAGYWWQNAKWLDDIFRVRFHEVINPPGCSYSLDFLWCIACSYKCGTLIKRLHLKKNRPVNFDPKKTLFLIDGSSFLYRAYYGLRPLNTPKGEPVQAVYGFCRMVKKLIDTFNPHYIALVWDSKGKTTRHEVYAEYKATRDVPPSDLFTQKEYITEFADLIGLAQLQTPGLEADDIMFSVAKEQKKDTNTIVFVTSDKDMGQAIDDKVVMYDTFKEQLIDEKAFEEKMGFPVEKLPFYFALLGDTSDNIPGVRGIGKKGAAELVLQFDSLEDLYARLDDVKKPRMRTALQDYRDNAFLSRDLFLLQYHKTGIHKKDLSFDPKNWQNARGLFKELNFKSLLKDMPVTLEQMSLFGSAEKRRPNFKAELVTTQEQLADLTKLLSASSVIALDTETDGLRPLQNRPVGISFAVQEGRAYYVPFGHLSGIQLSQEQVVAAVKPILENPSIKKWLHNAKFDALVLAHMGITLRGLDFDSMVAASLLVQNGTRLGLKSLSVALFDEQMLTFQEVVKAHKYPDFTHVPLELALEYAAADAHQTFKIAKKLKAELKDIPTLEALYNTIEHPLIEVLIAMEREGIHVDAALLMSLGKKIEKELIELHGHIIALVGEQFADINLNSPKQVEQLLFYELKLPPQKKTTKGRSYSTDAEALSVLAQLHVIPGLILKYRELFKLKSTYIDALPGYINPRTGRIHTTFSQTAVATGRLASSEPNLQNIPADTSGYGIEIRKAFQPKQGNVFISADYSQIELRVLAFFSQDAHLVDAFLRGADIHSQTAAKLFNVDPQAVTHRQRQIGKRINFSILYGLTPYGLSKDLNISFAEAKTYIETYFAQYPQVQAWMDSVIEETKERGYVTTYWGRRRYIPGIYEGNRALYEEAKRVAINTRAQGTAAEIMKQGMIALQEAFKEAHIEARMLLQIHDELLISVPAQQAQEAQAITQKILEGVVDWTVPLAVTTRVGADWKEVTK